MIIKLINNFRVWRYIVVNLILFHLFVFIFGIVPVWLYTIIVKHQFGDILGGMWSYVLITSIVIMAYILPSIYLAYKKKRSIPMYYEISGNYLIIYDRLLKKHQISLVGSVYTDNFFYCILGNYYTNTMFCGVTVYVYHKKLEQSFPLEFFDFAGRMRCFFPTDFATKGELCAFLECGGCKRISISYLKILLSGFIPATSFLLHYFIGLLFFNAIGFTGVYECGVIGLCVGGLFFVGFLTLPIVAINKRYSIQAKKHIRNRILFLIIVILLYVTRSSGLNDILCIVICIVLCVFDAVLLCHYFCNKVCITSSNGVMKKFLF